MKKTTQMTKLSLLHRPMVLPLSRMMKLVIVKRRKVKQEFLWPHKGKHNNEL